MPLSGGCRPPDSFEVQYFDGRFHSWNPVKLIKAFPERPREGENRVRFEPVQSSRFRLVLQNAGSDFYTGIYGLKPIDETQKDASPPSSPLRFTGDKFITADDLLVSVIRVHNPTDRVQTIYVEPAIRPAETFAYDWVGSVSGFVSLKDGEVSGREPRFLTLDGRQEMHGEAIDWRFRYAVVDDPPRTLKVGAERSARGVPFDGFAKPLRDLPNDLFKIHGHHIPPGKTKVFKAALRSDCRGVSPARCSPRRAAPKRHSMRSSSPWIRSSGSITAI